MCHVNNKNIYLNLQISYIHQSHKTYNYISTWFSPKRDYGSWYFSQAQKRATQQQTACNVWLEEWVCACVCLLIYLLVIFCTLFVWYRLPSISPIPLQMRKFKMFFNLFFPLFSICLCSCHICFLDERVKEKKYKTGDNQKFFCSKLILHRIWCLILK